MARSTSRLMQQQPLIRASDLGANPSIDQDSNFQAPGSGSSDTVTTGVGVIIVIVIVVLIVKTVVCVCIAKRCVERMKKQSTAAAATQHYPQFSDYHIEHATVERFLWEIRHEKPFRFTPAQLAGFTANYSVPLCTGGFGAVFKGALPNGLAVAVKVFHSSVDRRSGEAQFMAEVGTIGRTHHVNLVRLFGFCFDDAVRALVYEYMDKGALDAYLLGPAGRGAARHRRRRRARDPVPPRGVPAEDRALRHQARQRAPRRRAHAQGLRLRARAPGEPGGHARHGVRHARHPGLRRAGDVDAGGRHGDCDVYSFGMLLLDIVGRRRNFDEGAPESQQWFPKLAWTKYEAGELMDLAASPPRPHGDGSDADDSSAAAAASNDDEQQQQQCDKEIVERMCKVAFWCVQQQPEARPPMGLVVKILEGEVDIAPPVNPFQHLMAAPGVVYPWKTTTTSGATMRANGIYKDSNEIVSLY
ncbi:hypothetical protein BS78_02G031200 [Paspalum vaginatum]|nr:hypothetical protein BS78_02G031200 [Paspalum vaginatum]